VKIRLSDHPHGFSVARQFGVYAQENQRLATALRHQKSVERVAVVVLLRHGEQCEKVFVLDVEPSETGLFGFIDKARQVDLQFSRGNFDCPFPERRPANQHRLQRRFDEQARRCRHFPLANKPPYRVVKIFPFQRSEFVLYFRHLACEIVSDVERRGRLRQHALVAD